MARHERLVAQVVDRIRARGVFVFSVETDLLSLCDGSITGIAIYVPGNNELKPYRHWLPFIPGTSQNHSLMDHDNTLRDLRCVFSDPGITGIAHNVAHHVSFLEASGVEVSLRLACSMVAAYINDENQQSYRLVDLVHKRFGVEVVPYSESTQRQGTFHWDNERRGHLAIRRTIAIWKLFSAVFKELRAQDQEGDLEDLFWETEMPLTRVLMEMRKTGILIDPRPLYKIDANFEEKMDQIILDLTKKFGWTINPQSPADVSRMIYGSKEDGGLGLPPSNKKKNRLGNYSTKRADLDFWARRNKYVKAILEWRRMNSCRRNYIRRMLSASQTTRRIHCEVKQVRHPVGRMTCSSPVGITDMPKGDGLRRAISAHYSGDDESAGLEFLDIDYNQLELRALAHLSGDERMISSFLKEQCDCEAFLKSACCRHVDIHTLVAERLKISRERAKQVNYGIIYGMGPKLLALKAGLVTDTGSLDLKRARELIDGWYEFFYGVRWYFDHVERSTRTSRWIVRSESGRIRRLREEADRYKSNHDKLLRSACHFVVSAFATDLVKKAMIRIFNKRDELAKKNPLWKKVRFVLQVHDQFLFQIPKEIRDEVEKMVIAEAESGGSHLSVPLRISIRYGENWEDIHERQAA